MSQESNVYEMLWDCKFCGTTKLLAKSQKFCPVCGAAQDPKTQYFPSDDEKVAVKDHRFVGADLICGSCGTPNSASSEYCTQCGAPLANAQAVEAGQSRMAAAGERFDTGEKRDIVKEQMEADLARARAAEQRQQAARRRPLIIGAVIAVVVIIIGVIAFLMSTTQAGVLVTGHSWERVINIEDYGPRAESAWRDQVPVNYNAGSLTCSRRQRDTRQVPDGEECRNVQVNQGDGTFRQERQCTTRYRDEPIYDDWCAFTVDRWAVARTVKAEGDSLDDNIAWPQTNITRTGTCNGCEREGERQERYIVYFKNTQNDSTYECAFTDQSQWASFRVESLWQMDIRRTGSPVCDSLKQG